MTYPGSCVGELTEGKMAEDKQELKEEHSKKELYEKAQDKDVEGRSDMDKDELAEELAETQEGSGGSGPVTAAADTRHPQDGGPGTLPPGYDGAPPRY